MIFQQQKDSEKPSEMDQFHNKRIINITSEKKKNEERKKGIQKIIPIKVELASK